MAWIVINGELTNTDLFELPAKPMSESCPDVMWRVSDEELKTNLLPKDTEMGAFCHCTNLSRVSIPDSVKQIGMYSFRNAALKNVKIAPDCEYYPTSFPGDCEISGGAWDMLADVDGNLIADKAGRQIYVRRAD